MTLLLPYCFVYFNQSRDAAAVVVVVVFVVVVTLEDNSNGHPLFVRKSEANYILKSYEEGVTKEKE